MLRPFTFQREARWMLILGSVPFAALLAAIVIPAIGRHASAAGGGPLTATDLLRAARRFVAVMMLVTVPPSVTLWYAIHPLALAWRRIGAAATYLALLVPYGGLAVWLYRHRDVLLGRDLGSQPLLFATAVAAASGGWLVARRRRGLLTQRILVGVPELSAKDTGRLLTEGIYARIRNPRYVEFELFVLAYVAFANHVGTWVLFLLTFPAIHLVVLLEERELRSRFGAEYVDYCQRVPRYLPRRTAR
jgi:protein-S-isoprenylcysteine O-methyltransferase Ste14